MQVSKDALKVLKGRRSVRKYRDEKIPENIVEDIIDCARLAPTARNEQPWEFIVITDKKKNNQIAEITDHGKFIAEAPLCIAVFCKNTKYYLEDGSAATTNILLAAQAYGLGGCWVAGDKKHYAADIQKLLNIPTEYKLVSLISLGYPAEKSTPEKRALNQVLHKEQW
jgi:nitroreductase